MLRPSLIATAIVLVFIDSARAENVAENSVTERARFSAPEARQAVAVDNDHFYAITNTAITKNDKETGKLVKRWDSSDQLPLIHLNSGVVCDGELFCAHSNFPNYPEVSSIEVWDTSTLEHQQSHSLGICDGSLTWIDYHRGAWWGVFAHYTEKVNDNPIAKNTRWTSFVRFDSDWRVTAAWVFPQELLERFEPLSCSGGSWGKDGLLHCTGHDRREIYAVALPRAGSVLELRKTISVPTPGQGIAWDRSADHILYGIDRARGEVVVIDVSSNRVAQVKSIDK